MKNYSNEEIEFALLRQSSKIDLMNYQLSHGKIQFKEYADFIKEEKNIFE
jgi:hypothetical protein